MNNEPAVMAIGKWLSKNTRKVENIFNIRPASEVKEHRMDPPIIKMNVEIKDVKP